MADKEKTKEKEERFVLEEITTETGIAVKDNATGNYLSDKAITIQILNDLEVLKKALL